MAQYQGTTLVVDSANGTVQYTAKELKRLSRKQLIDMLYELSSYEQDVQKELSEAKTKLENRQIALQESGSIAEASLKVNDIFTVAQAAADDYLSSIREIERQSHVLVTDAEKQKETLLSQAQAQCDQLRAQTEQEVQELRAQAEKEVQELRASAKAQTDQLIQETETLCKAQETDSSAKAAAMITQADAHQKQVEETCKQKLSETEQTVAERWDEFQKNVKKTLEAHAELEGMLSHLTEQQA